jgi:membrane protein insertase Oxa1/YidC/SpoIIIJ
VYSWPHAAHAIHRLLCLSFSKHDAWACCSLRGHAHPVSKTDPAVERHTRQLAIKNFPFFWAPFFSLLRSFFSLLLSFALSLVRSVSFIGAASTTQKQKTKTKKQKNKNKKNKKHKKSKKKTKKQKNKKAKQKKKRPVVNPHL